MKLLTLIALIVMAAFCASENIVCYYQSWTIYNTSRGKFSATNVDPTLCTHIVYAFIGVNEGAGILTGDDWQAVGTKELALLSGYKTQNPNLKVMVSMAPSYLGSAALGPIAKDSQLLSTFINNLLQFLKENEVDGFDLDDYWESEDDPLDPATYISLLKSLKSALNDNGYILSIAASGYVDSTYNISALTDSVDLVNLMTYDYHGYWDGYVGHYAPLYQSSLDTTGDSKLLNVVAGVENWINNGADLSKVNLGIGTYGRSFTLADSSNPDLYANITARGEEGPYSKHAGVLGYNEICEFHSDWEYVWDDEQKVPHRYGGDQWVGYDDEDSIALKVRYAKEVKLGGILIWSLDSDDYLGTCGGGQYPLLKTINKVLKA